MIVTTGASGQLGRLVASALADRLSPANVTLGARDPGKIADLAAKGFKTAAVDFNKPESLVTAFAGADSVLIISGDAPNDIRIRQHRVAIDAAKAAGVGHVVYTSFANATPASLFPFAAIHADSEAYLKASDIPYTILRNNQYAENLTLAAARQTGELALPGISGKVAYITRADLAAATAAVLAQPSHDGKVYELTGAEALDTVEVADLLTKIWTTPVRAIEVPPGDYGSALAARGLPPFVVEALVGLRQAVAAGEYAAVSDDARRLAGRPLETVRAFLARA